MTTLLFTLLVCGSPRGLTRPKTSRPHRVRRRAERVINLYQVHTKEILSLAQQNWAPLPTRRLLNWFFRCRVTHRTINMDRRLPKLLRESATHFGAEEIHIVSAFRSPRFNTELKKKLHQVAQRSHHTRGKAVDFSLQGVPPLRVAKWLRKRRIGGVGYYKTSSFLHLDTGPVRNWSGT